MVRKRKPWEEEQKDLEAKGVKFDLEGNVIQAEEVIKKETSIKKVKDILRRRKK